MSTEATPSPRQGSRAKRYLLIGTAVVASYVAAYFLGYTQGRGEMSALEQQRSHLETELTKGKAAAATELDAERRRSTTLEARRALDQALLALDERNFGIAQQRLKQSAQQLTSARAEGRLLEIAKSLDAYRLLATEDLGAQRQKLAAYLAEFDQIYSNPKP